MAIKLVAKKQDVDLYPFGFAEGQQKGNSSMKELLGGKGANLSEMASIGIPVPAGVTIPTTYCIKYLELDLLKRIMLIENLRSSVTSKLVELEKKNGYMPLFSVRSGARVSMPGMMDTILNVGLTMDNIQDWAERIGDIPALDSYRRLIQMFGSVVHGIPLPKFEAIMEHHVSASGKPTEQDLDVEELEALISDYLALYTKEVGTEFPDTLDDQLGQAISAVFESWNNERAQEYRKIHAIPDDWGTAVTVQSMVFGNMGDDCATGVVFTRDPSNGADMVTGEFLVNAQGEDVVAGIRTPMPLEEMDEWSEPTYLELDSILHKLETHYKDMQDVEFTVQQGHLYILQTRSGKRSAKAAFEIAYDMLEEGLITIDEASTRVNSDLLEKAMTSVVSPKWKTPPTAEGTPAGGGVVQGVVALDVETALAYAKDHKVILVTKETDPDDIAGMNVSVGILTATGGLTSHAAVVARGMNKTCVVGCVALEWETETKVVVKDQTGSIVVQNGDSVTIDGSTGKVWFHKNVPIDQGSLTPKASKLLSLIHKSKGNSPIVVEATNTQDFGVIPWEGNSTIVLRTAILEKETGASRIVELMKATAEAYPTNVRIIDVSLYETYDMDSMFLYTMTKSDNQEYFKSRVLAVCAEIVSSGIPCWVKSNHFEEDIKSNFPTISILPKISSLSGLLGAGSGSLVTVDESVLTTVFESKEVFVKLANLVGVEQLVSPTHWFKVLE